MNIFVSDANPRIAARNLDSKRVIKMVLESAQILSTVLRQNGCTEESLYRISHSHHPIVLWTGRTRGNFLWLARHYKYLLLEYSRRYSKSHKTGISLPYSMFKELAIFIPDGERTEFQNSTRDRIRGIDYTHVPNVCHAYTLYLKAKWRTDARHPTW